MPVTVTFGSSYCAVSFLVLKISCLKHDRFFYPATFLKNYTAKIFYRVRHLVRKAFILYAIANFLFFLDKPFGYAQGETKKIKAANKKAEIFNICLKLRNSPA